MMWVLVAMVVLTTVQEHAVDFGAEAASLGVVGAKPALGKKEVSYSFPSASNGALRVVEDLPTRAIFLIDDFDQTIATLDMTSGIVNMKIVNPEKLSPEVISVLVSQIRKIQSPALIFLTDESSSTRTLLSETEDKISRIVYDNNYVGGNTNVDIHSVKYVPILADNMA